jgi:hypothetical protein
VSVDFITDKIVHAAGTVAFDIGANRGKYTKLMAIKFAKVYAFEPILATSKDYVPRRHFSITSRSCRW